MTRLRLTIVVPCFNEAGRVVATVGTLRSCADAIVGADSWELLVVDDASTDDTPACLAALVADEPRLRVIHPTHGKGKGAAVRAGLLAARGAYVFVTDADLAGAPAQVADFLDVLDHTGADAALGTRVARASVVDPPRQLSRRAPAAVFRAFVHAVGRLDVADPQCGFKVFRAAAVRAPAAALATDGFAYEVELLLRMQAANAVLVDVPITWSEGVESDVRVGRDGVVMVLDVLRIGRRLRRERCSSAGHHEPADASLALSVVMPVYNEVDVVEAVVDEVRRCVLEHPDVAGSVELVLVDDCGTDGSSAIMQRLASIDPRIRVIVNDTNSGHGPSVLNGLDAARGEWLLQLDSDGQVDLAGFESMWARRRGADLVFGTRVARDDPRHRLVLTRFVNALVTVLARRRVVDANAGCKLLHRPLYHHLRPMIPHDTFAPSLLLVLAGIRAAAVVVPEPVVHRARASGRSSLNAGQLARAIARATVQTARFASRRIPPYRRPLGAS